MAFTFTPKINAPEPKGGQCFGFANRLDFPGLCTSRQIGGGSLLLQAQALQGQKPVGQHHQHPMAVEPVPGAAFKMVQP